LSNVYFIRHGQAGTRESYDSLSELGRRQARLLGRYFVSQGIEFAAAHAGRLLRQQQTAAEVAAAYLEAGRAFPELTTESGWDEFDFHHIYYELAPLMCEDDPEFRREHEAVRASAGNHDAEVHRRWRPSDTRVVEAWAGGLYPYGGESWEQFVGRVSSCRLRTREEQPRPNLVVFTSATPTAVWTGKALGINDGRIRRLAGVLENTSYTLLQLRGEELLLLSFNSVPHLQSPELRTRR
jgi:broad specificity phosphatase PhoE